MKTLDEVINIMEGCGLIDWGADALHYLKHLQEYYEMSREHHEPNPALTWQELKQMEGKPVWVETRCGKYATWEIVDHFDVSEYGIVRMFLRGDGYLEKQEQGDVWQAYRKEQNENVG